MQIVKDYFTPNKSLRSYMNQYLLVTFIIVAFGYMKQITRNRIIDCTRKCRLM